jgi:transcriptional regulator with XRE-family HTH domain
MDLFMKTKAKSSATAPLSKTRSRRPAEQRSDPLLGLEHQIGQRLRDVRLSKDLSLSEVALQAGISVGNLSQIERGLTVASIRTFCMLARALGIEAGWLLEQYGMQPDNDHPHIVRASSARSIVFSKQGVIKRLASPVNDGSLQMLVVEIAPEASSGDRAYTHAGEECGIVLEGVLELVVDDELHTLGAGDSFRFKSTLPHRFSNPGNVPAKVIWVISPPLY